MHFWHSVHLIRLHFCLVQVKSDGKLNTLYIIAGIDPETAVFAPLTKGEIGAFGWHSINELPATLEEANKAYLSSAGVKHRFFMVGVNKCER